MTRVVLFGMRCAFTGPVLDAFRAAPGIDLAGVVLSGAAPPSPRLHADAVLDTIEAAGVPLLTVSARSGLAAPPFRTGLEALRPDAIVVACFPWRLPRWLRELPPRGCLNLHPSLLPDGRGPEPVFWAFRRGLEETGVTLHLMDERLDAGPIITQARMPIPEGATIPSLERALAEIGARLALDHLRDRVGRSQGVPQPDGGVYAPFPGATDLLVPTSWAARHASRFIHAAVSVYGAIPVLVLATGQRLAVEAVVHVEDDAGHAPDLAVDGDLARIRFATGVLTCLIARTDHPLRLHP